MRRQRTADETEREEERAPAAPEPSRSPAAQLLTLQQTLGNAAVSRMVARAPVTAPPGPTSASSDYDKARAARDAFVLAGKKGPVTYNPSTRNPANYYGGFDVAYDPAAQTLQILRKGPRQNFPGQ